MGTIASFLNLGSQASYSVVQKALTTGSLILATIIRRYSLSTKSRGMPIRVVPGVSIKAKTQLSRIYSILADQTLAQIFVKIAIRPEATKCLCSGSLTSRTLKPIGYFESIGLK